MLISQEVIEEDTKNGEDIKCFSRLNIFQLFLV